ncbi:MAG: hypothetical protein ACKVT0_00640 [Planctomycetaceae bacterium]
MSEPDAKPDGVVPTNTDAGLWTRLRETPLADALRGKWTRSLNMPVSLSSFELPESLQGFVIDVARKTRLWHKEQLDVAKELAGHFRDGLDAGATSEQLIERFGDALQAAKMIRRARIRCRPLHWQIRHWSMQSARVIICVFMLWYAVLAFRYFSSSPLISKNYYDEMNAVAKAIPEEDRAWPFYREAIVDLRVVPGDWEKHWWNKSVFPPPIDSTEWRDLTTYVDRNQNVLPLIHQGAKRQQLGYQFGDSSNREFLQTAIGRDDDLVTSNPMLIEMPFAQLEGMRSLSRLLHADAILAASRGNRDHLTNNIHSLLALSTHCRANGFFMEEQISRQNLDRTMKLISDVLSDYPQLHTNEQLIDIAHALSIHSEGNSIQVLMEREFWIFEDIMQRTFSDDGNGDGHLTPAGSVLFQEMGDAGIAPLLCTRNDASSTHTGMKTLNTLSKPGIMSLVGTRKENLDLLRELYELGIADNNGPYYSWKESRQEERIDALNNSFATKIKYGPVLLFITLARQYAVGNELIIQQRDGILTAIALELYHRHEQKWPKNLDELVPRYLPAVPLDRITGDDIKFTIVNDRPMVYSVGKDRQDDGGRTSTERQERESASILQGFAPPKSIPRPGEGIDWILCPRFRETLSEKDVNE